MMSKNKIVESYKIKYQKHIIDMANSKTSSAFYWEQYDDIVLGDGYSICKIKRSELLIDLNFKGLIKINGKCPYNLVGFVPNNYVEASITKTVEEKGVKILCLEDDRKRYFAWINGKLYSYFKEKTDRFFIDTDQCGSDKLDHYSLHGIYIQDGDWNVTKGIIMPIMCGKK